MRLSFRSTRKTTAAGGAGVHIPFWSEHGAVSLARRRNTAHIDLHMTLLSAAEDVNAFAVLSFGWRRFPKARCDGAESSA